MKARTIPAMAALATLAFLLPGITARAEAPSIGEKPPEVKAEGWLNSEKPLGFGSPTAGNYGVSGIPTAFVVGTDGKVIWSGHPLDEAFEAALDKALAGAERKC